MRQSLSSDLERRLSAGAGNAGQVLLETESLAVLEAIGISVPRHEIVVGPEAASELDLETFTGDQVVVKVVSERISHKTEVGGVTTCARDLQALTTALSSMRNRFQGEDVVGFSVHEFVIHDGALGGELLVGARWTPEFGPVVTLGLGGIETERLAASGLLEPLFMEAGKGSGPHLPIASTLIRFLTESYRGRQPRIERRALEEVVARLAGFSCDYMPAVSEIEINPLALTDEGPVALDALIRLGCQGVRSEPPKRPVEKLGHLLEPTSIAIMGVSKGINPGRIILRNILGQGFDCNRVWVVKPGAESIDGCRCYPTLDDLPARVDLLVLAVEALNLPTLLEEIVSGKKAESVILIPGGLGERSGSVDRVRRIQQCLLDSRASEWRGPVVNGANCLGVRSLPGGFDTMFIPKHKLIYSSADETPLALISQSGAFAVARASHLESLNPRYVVSIGNQIDLTLGDYLQYLKDDQSIEVFACYVEGFVPGDGRQWLETARQITAEGRPVILYRAGRTHAGASAAASHTASIAGSYAVTRALAKAAGVMVAESIADFDDLIRLACLLRNRSVAGSRLGALSNAGFESVAFADRLGGFRLAELQASTREGLCRLLEDHRLEDIVTVSNPLDVTPILDDEAFALASRALIEDESVDLAVIGCVPLTGALNTLAGADNHREEFQRNGSLAQRLASLWQETRKAWVVVIDGGALYDPMARFLEESGIPTFRSADRALRILNIYCSWLRSR